jgi:hypothetical protein
MTTTTNQERDEAMRETDDLPYLTLFEVEAFFGTDKTVIRYVAAGSMHEALSVLAEEDELVCVRLLGGLFRVAKSDGNQPETSENVGL